MKIEFDIELENDADHDVNPIAISCTVTRTNDPFGTGDSPAEYEVEDITAWDANGEVFKLNARQDNIVAQRAIQLFEG